MTVQVPDGTLPAMDDKEDPWRRLVDARLSNLERALRMPRLRRAKSGRPLPAHPYEPGDREPLTRWLEVRMTSIEMLLRLILNADSDRADELDIEPLETRVDFDLGQLWRWAESVVEPDMEKREAIAVILLARTILAEVHEWPLMDLEEGV